jgi:hypothetical protein
MAVPWQTDTASCRSGYYAGYGPRYDPYVPAFWPARVPNHVLTFEDYSKVIDGNMPREERLSHYNQRADWLRGVAVPGDYEQTINNMVRDFGKLGVVETRNGVLNDPDFPSVMRVESPPNFPAAAHGALLAVPPTGQPPDQVVSGTIEKVRRFPRGLKTD